MITTADVNKLKCKFISEVYQVIQDRKYSTEYCWGKSKTAYLNLKSASIDFSNLDCDLSPSRECEILDSVSDTSVITCDTQTLACGDQGTVTLSQIGETHAYYRAHRPNTYPTYLLGSDSVNSSISDILQIQEQDSNGNWVTKASSTITYNYVLAYNTIDLPKVITPSAAYIHSINVEYTYAGGTPASITIDTSPLTCGSLTGASGTFSASNLYFSSGSFSTTFFGVINNYLRTNVGFTSDVFVGYWTDAGSGKRLYVQIKNAATNWAGIGNPYIVYNNGVASTTHTSKGVFTTKNASYTTWSNNSVSYTTPGGTISASFVNPPSVYVNIAGSSKYDNIIPIWNDSRIAPTVTTTGTYSYEQWTLKAVITNVTPVYQYYWQISTGVNTWGSATDINQLTKTVTVAGTYRFTLELESGCVIRQTITITSSS